MQALPPPRGRLRNSLPSENLSSLPESGTPPHQETAAHSPGCWPPRGRGALPEPQPWLWLNFKTESFQPKVIWLIDLNKHPPAFGLKR